MSSSSASGSAPTVTETITEFARRNEGNMVIVSFPPNQDGFTPPQLMGIIRHQHIETPPGSVYPNPQVFPRAGTSYAQIMTSVDGNTTTAVFSPSGPPTAEEGLQMLRPHCPRSHHAGTLGCRPGSGRGAAPHAPGRGQTRRTGASVSSITIRDRQ